MDRREIENFIEKNGQALSEGREVKGEWLRLSQFLPFSRANRPGVRKVLTYARDCLSEHLPLQAEGYERTTEDLLNVWLGVAANCGTLQSVCADLVGMPDPETIRTYFKEQLCVEDLPDLEQRLNAALAAEIPPRVWRRAQEVAIDFHDRPYYGKTLQAEGLWVRGQARDGTTRFYRIATAYVMLKHLRVTLALRFVLPDEDTVTIVDDLRKRLKTLGIRVAELFLDKGFEGIAVMDYLTRQGQPALIACTIRGKTGGMRALCQGNKSYRTTYTFHGQNQTAFSCVIRGMPITDSGACRSLIPAHADH